MFTHESDLTPGLATRLNAKRADKILVSWEKTLGYLPEAQRAKAAVVGNPVRAAIGNGDPAKGLAWLGFTPGLPLVLVLGGSQGARQVNELIAAILPELNGKARVAHQTGPGHEPCRPADSGYKGFEFVREEMADVLAAADIVIGRAGAGTLWEGAASGKAMIFIPLAGSGNRGDQVDNAELLAAAGAAICLTGAAATPKTLIEAVLMLVGSAEKRAAMAMAAQRTARPDAAAAIAEMILAHIHRETTS
ncbi:MAG: hypothetical protein A2Z96_01225 [Spirochaetes bacterium GWB1_48_6]|nr:MAG: hypothetical protein A2Z96_01225 [Spirochaetes bacterium GWB1_48_6]